MQNNLLKRFALIFLILIIISCAVVYFTFDVNAIDYLLLFKPWSIAAVLAVLGIGLFFDGTRLMNLSQASGEKMSVRAAVEVVLSNYFLALITPGASGGAVAQVVFMNRAGIPTAKATAIVIVRTAMSIGFLLVLVPFILYHDHSLVSWLPTEIILSISVFIVLIPVLMIIFLNTRYPKHWLYAATSRFSKPIRRKSFLWYKEFRKAAFMLGKNPFSVFRAFIESGISLLAIYSVVPVFLASFGLNFSYQIVMGRMILLNLLLYFAPTPGGSGIAEAGFILLFSPLLPDGTVGIMAVIWRFVCEYIPFILGGIVCIRAFGSNFINGISLGKKE